MRLLPTSRLCMKLIMVADQYPPTVGGAERQAHKLSVALVERGHDVRVLTGRWQREMAPREVLDGVEVERLNTMLRMGGIRGVRKFAEDLFHRAVAHRLRDLAGDADVFHSHALRRAAYAALQVGMETGVPVLAKERSGGSGNSFRTLAAVHRGGIMEDYFLSHLRHVVVLNSQAQREYEGFGFKDLEIHRMVNGVSVGDQTPVWQPTDPPHLLFLGRVHDEKGARPLLEAFALIKDELPELRMRVCGDGPGLAPLRARISELDLADRVETPGSTLQPLAELAMATAVVLPSHTEGMSNTLLEALAVGTPVVASAVPGNAEVLGELGWLVPRVEPADLAQGLREVMASTEERVRRSSAQRQLAHDRYSMQAVAADYEALYERLRTN